MHSMTSREGKGRVTPIDRVRVYGDREEISFAFQISGKSHVSGVPPIPSGCESVNFDGSNSCSRLSCQLLTRQLCAIQVA